MRPLAKTAVFLLLLLGVVSQSQASWDEARELVEGATKNMVTLLGDPELKDEAAFPELFGSVDRVLEPVVDFKRIARGVMAKHYRNASSQQREQFADVFKSTLVKTYAKALATFNFQRYEVIENRSPSKKPNKQTVKVDVFGTDGTRYNLVYFVLKGKNGWKITNVHLDGINLRQIFKNQFADVANGHKGDIDKVISEWAALVDTESVRES